MVIEYKRAVGVFPSRQKAEEALEELRNSGFVMDRVSVLAKDEDRSDRNRNDQVSQAQGRTPGENEAPEGAGIGATAGTVLGGVGGLLVGLEALIIPGVGPFLAAGTIATTLAGAGIGAAAGGIVGALTGMGIPEEQAQSYNDQMSQGGYLVIIDGAEDELNRAGSIFKKHSLRDWSVYELEGKYAAAPARTENTNTTPVIDRTSERYVDSTTVDRGVVEIVDKRDEIRH